MKRFELVDGKSSKFWEVALVGSDLELSWGRIGSDGQSQTKSFASPEKAALERDKLIRSKTKKGYALVSDDEGGAQASATPTTTPEVATAEPSVHAEPTRSVVASSSDQDPEDIMVLPDKVLKNVHAWRGRPSAVLARAEIEKQKKKQKAESLWALVHTEGVEIAKNWIHDEREPVLQALKLLTAETLPETWDAQVQGAAGALVGYWAAEAPTHGASAEIRKTMTRSQAASTAIVQLWLKQRGILFATQAVLESLRLFSIETYTLLAEFRRQLAASDAADYAEALRIAAVAWDDMQSAQRAILAYLFPTEQVWTDAVLEKREAMRDDWQLKMLVASARTPEALGQADWMWSSTSRVKGHPVFFWTAVEAVGPALVPELTRALSAEYPQAPKQRQSAEALSYIASDDALAGLLDHPDAAGVGAALAEAVERFPRRAMRLLAARSKGASAETLERHEMLMRLAESACPADPPSTTLEAEPQRDAREPVSSAPEAAKNSLATNATASEAPQATHVDTTLPDEDVLVLPPKLMRYAHPRRGYPSGDAVSLTKPASTAKLWSHVHAAWQKVADEPWTLAADPELLERTRGLLSSETPPSELDPKAQGLAATMLALDAYADPAKALPSLVDLWVALGGVEQATALSFEAITFRQGQSYQDWALIPADDSGPTFRQPTATHFLRLRTWLAAADAESYAQARAVCARRREQGLAAQYVSAFLVPTERAWVDEALAGWSAVASSRSHPAYFLRLLLLSSLTTDEQLATIADTGLMWASMAGAARPSIAFPSMIEGLGAELLPQLTRWLENESYGHIQQSLIEACSLLPTDAAMNVLLDRLDDRHAMSAATEMVTRFPRRAVRLVTARIVADGKQKRALTPLLRIVRASHPGAFDAVAQELSAAQRGAWDELSQSQPDAPMALAEELPAVLASPPWTRKKKPKARKVLKLEPLEREPEMRWLDGEREAWSAGYQSRGVLNVGWQAMLGELRSGKLKPWLVGSLLVEAPEEIAFAAATSWYEKDRWQLEHYGKAAIARLGARATEAMAYLCETQLAAAMPYIQPFEAPVFAPFVADAFVRLKSTRKLATMFLERHPEAAAFGLIPDALGKAGKPQRSAESALRYLDSQGHGDALRAVAKQYGEAASEALDVLLAADARDVFPKKMPTLPTFWTMAAPPAPLLKESGHALPSEAVEQLGLMLAISKPGEPYAGVEDVREACTAESLARFAWALFEGWHLAAMPAKESWAFDALGLLGDDEVARRLTPLIRAWPGEGGHQRAVQGLEVLAAIGTDVALMHLYGIAQKLKFKGLQKHAQAKIQQIAEERELTTEQLADRLVPDLGLDDSGSLVLDYGPRQFTVGFDESLKPFVRQNGKLLKSLPKPGAKDDDELAPAADKRFSALKKDARAVAKQQIERLELGMVAQRRWSPTEFQRFFLEHPLVVHLTRRLVWECRAQEGAPSYFRVAEDGTLASVEDEEFQVPEDGSVAIAHALTLGRDTTHAWADVLADYEILQPFAQLGRETFAIEDEEVPAKSLTRFVDRKVHYGKVLGLEALGWRRADAEDGGVIACMTKPLGEIGTATLELDPGMIVGMLGEWPEQTLRAVSVGPASAYGGYCDPAQAKPLGELSPIQFSELVRDLSLVVG